MVPLFLLVRPHPMQKSVFLRAKFFLAKPSLIRQGNGLFILEKSLAVGQHLISIAMGRDDGSTTLADLSLAIEIYGDAATKPLVALLPETSTEVPLLIQSPDDGKSATSNVEVTHSSNSNEVPKTNVGAAPNVNNSVISGVDPTDNGAQVDPKRGLAAYANCNCLAGCRAHSHFWHITGWESCDRK